MKTKLFISFIFVIFTALISDVVFRWLILHDFEEYVRQIEKDRIYWLIAAVEGSYGDGKWNEQGIIDAVHWGMMFGLDMTVFDRKGQRIMDSHRAMEGLTPSMKQKMEHLVDRDSSLESHSIYPLTVKGIQVGMVKVKPILREEFRKKEEMFKERVRRFMAASFAIAAAGAVGLAFLFSSFLSRPVRKLKEGASAIAKGHLSCRIPITGTDEIGSLAASFNYMAEALEREDEIRKRVMANITHQLRTPLAVIKATMEAMADGITGQEEAMKNIKNTTEKLISLVKGIEDISMAEASFFEQGRLVSFDLKEFLIDMAGEYRPTALQKSLTLTVADRPAMMVTTDGEKLTAILDNILSNAIRYTVTGAVAVDFSKEGSFFAVQVEDTGPGIDKEELPLVFERFYRGKHSTGMGIGLSIARELAGILKGTVEMESTPGKGTVVVVRLPQGSG